MEVICWLLALPNKVLYSLFGSWASFIAQLLPRVWLPSGWGWGWREVDCGSYARLSLVLRSLSRFSWVNVLYLLYTFRTISRDFNILLSLFFLFLPVMVVGLLMLQLWKWIPLFHKVEFLSYDGARRLAVLSITNKQFFKSGCYVLFMRFQSIWFSLLCFSFSV